MDRELIQQNDIEYFNFTVDIKEATIDSSSGDNYITYDNVNNVFKLNFNEPINNIVNVKIVDCTISKPDYLIFNDDKRLTFNFSSGSSADGTSTPSRNETLNFTRDVIYPFVTPPIDQWDPIKLSSFGTRYFNNSSSAYIVSQLISSGTLEGKLKTSGFNFTYNQSELVLQSHRIFTVFENNAKSTFRVTEGYSALPFASNATTIIGNEASSIVYQPYDVPFTNSTLTSNNFTFTTATHTMVSTPSQSTLTNTINLDNANGSGVSFGSSSGSGSEIHRNPNDNSIISSGSSSFTSNEDGGFTFDFNSNSNIDYNVPRYTTTVPEHNLTGNFSLSPSSNPILKFPTYRGVFTGQTTSQGSGADVTFNMQVYTNLVTYNHLFIKSDDIESHMPHPPISKKQGLAKFTWNTSLQNKYVNDIKNNRFEPIERIRNISFTFEDPNGVNVSDRIFYFHDIANFTIQIEYVKYSKTKFTDNIDKSNLDFHEYYTSKIGDYNLHPSIEKQFI